MYDATELPVTEQVHLVVVLTASPAPLLEAVAYAMSRTGAQLRQFSLCARGDSFEATVRLTGVDEAKAELCASLIRAAWGVSLVSLEHQLLKP